MARNARDADAEGFRRRSRVKVTHIHIQSDSVIPAGIHRLAVLTAAAAFVLIVAGGLVTSTGSGLAVPDWPLSFGTLFPRMVGGVRYEHTHRLIAGAVLLLTATLTGWIWRRDARPWLVRLSLAALGAVVLQALLGGATVLLRLPPAVSIAHAGLAQIFFALAVSLAVLTRSPSPPVAGARVRGEGWGEGRVRGLCVATTAAIYLQTLLGAVIRHTGAALVIPDFPLAFGRLIPPIESARVAVQFAHRVGAAVVAALVLATAASIFSSPPRGDGTSAVAEGRVRGLAVGLLLLLLLQIALGAGIIWTLRAVPVSTAHVAVGALLFGASVWLTLVSAPWPARHPAPPPAPRS